MNVIQIRTLSGDVIEVCDERWASVLAKLLQEPITQGAEALWLRDDVTSDEHVIPVSRIDSVRVIKGGGDD